MSPVTRCRYRRRSSRPADPVDPGRPRSKALRSATVRVGNLDVHDTQGGGGPPAVFIHGLGSSGYMEWRFTLPHFARTNHVYAPDLPGFGRSDKPRTARYGIPFFARTIDRYLAARRISSAPIIGTSMGGRIALELALRYPSRVSRLVVVNSLGLGRPKIQPYYPLMLVPRLGEGVLHGMKHALNLAPGTLIRRVARRYMGARGDLEQTLGDDYLSDLRDMHMSDGYAAAYVATVRSFASPSFFFGSMDVSGELSKIKVPVMIVWGANDPLFPIQQALRAHAAIPGSRLVIIEGAGHTPQAERPEEFNRHVSAFLRE